MAAVASEGLGEEVAKGAGIGVRAAVGLGRSRRSACLRTKSGVGYFGSIGANDFLLHASRQKGRG